jgi:NADPH:quinone reductase-like Zn-dependent oxidoreductase
MELLHAAMTRGSVTARAFDRIARVARTIADLDGAAEISHAHVAEALVARLIGGRGARVAFDPIAGPGIEPLARAMSSGGIIVLYGALSSGPTPYPLFTALAKRLTLRAYVLFEITDPKLFAEGKRYILDGLEVGRLTPIIAKTDSTRSSQRIRTSNRISRSASWS